MAKMRLFSFFFLLSVFTFSQPIRFQITYGTPINDWGLAIPVSSGGYALLVDDVTNPSLHDIALIRLDSGGTIVWNKTYSNTSAANDSWNGIIEAFDGGFLISGVLNANTSNPVYIWIRTNSNGDTLWVKQGLGGSNIIKTADFGYAIVGMGITKTDSMGNIEWSKEYPGGFPGIYSAGHQTTDRGYIILGQTTLYSSGLQDLYAIKTDSLGNVQWTKVFGGPNSIEYSSDIVQTNDGGYLALGYTNGFGMGGYDMLLVKMDQNGNIIWTKTYGGASNDIAVDLKATGAVGYIITGYTPGFETVQNGSRSFLLRTDALGNAVWAKMYGNVTNVGFSSDEAAYVHYTNDGGFLISGSTQSFGTGGYEPWVIKTDPLGVSGCNEMITNPDTTNPVLTVGVGGADSSIPLVSSPITIALGSWQPQQTILCLSGPPGIGIEEETNPVAIHVFPNPAYELLNIEIKGLENVVELEVFDMLGQHLKSSEITSSQTTINISSFAPGIYVLRVVSSEGTINSTRFIKE